MNSNITVEMARHILFDHGYDDDYGYTLSRSRLGFVGEKKTISLISVIHLYLLIIDDLLQYLTLMTFSSIQKETLHVSKKINYIHYGDKACI